MFTERLPADQVVLQPSSTITPPCVLCRTIVSPQQQREMQLKFFIGLRLLGEKRKERFLAYMLTLQQTSDKNGKTTERKEGEK